MDDLGTFFDQLPTIVQIILIVGFLYLLSSAFVLYGVYIYSKFWKEPLPRLVVLHALMFPLLLVLGKPDRSPLWPPRITS